MNKNIFLSFATVAAAAAERDLTNWYRFGFHPAILTAVLVSVLLLAGEAIASDSSASSLLDHAVEAADLTMPQLSEPLSQGYEDEWENADSETTRNQLTSVFQLSDVQAEDWAFQALQSLVERYGCIVGYPDGTYRGGRSLTRYEFAAGLNACLDRLTELIEQSSAELVRQEDWATLQRLQTEFAAELAALTERVDTLEARSAELEANQFSTTTVLTGQVWFNLTGATADDAVQAETSSLETPLNLRPAARDSRTGAPIISDVEDDPSLTFSYYAWLNLNTSFTGRDTLVTQLAVGNAVSPANSFISAGLFNTFGVPFTDQTGTTAADKFVVRELFYDFPIGDSLQVAVGPRINWYRYFDANAYTFFVTGASSYNSSGGTLVNAVDRGSGAVVRWDISDQFDLAVGYLGENTEFLPGEFFNTASNPDKGLFEGTNTLSVGLTYSPSSRANIRFLYNRSVLDTNVAIRNETGEITGFGVGGATGEPIYGVADDGFGGSIEDAEAHAFSVSADWLVTDRFGLFGRYTYATTDIDPTTSGRADGSVEAQSVQAGVALLDLGKPGARLTLSYLIPFSVLDGRRFLAAGGGDGGVQYELEATYYFPLTDNLALVPALYFVGNPNNFSDNPDVWVGNLRTQFRF